MKNLFYTLTMAIAITACSGDDEGSNACDYTSIDFYIAVSRYQENPTSANCTALQQEAEEYYNAMQDCDELYDATEIQVAQEFINLDCN